MKHGYLPYRLTHRGAELCNLHAVATAVAKIDGYTSYKPDTIYFFTPSLAAERGLKDRHLIPESEEA